MVFYVPWDEHIKPFAPKLEMSYADLLKRGYTVKFGSVNVAENRQLGWKYQIDRSPLVKILMYDDVSGGWKVTNYNGEREPMPVCEACIERHRIKNIPYTPLPADHTDGDVIELDDTNFNELVFGSNQVWQIAFTAPWCYHCKLMYPAFEAAAKDFGGEVRFATINADKNRGLARRFNIQALPTIKYFEGGYGKTDDSAKTYEGGRTEQEIYAATNKLLEDYESNPNKPAWISPEDAATAKKLSHASSSSSSEQCEYDPDAVDQSCQSALPTEVKSVCQDGSLCVVAFLSESYARERQIKDLGVVAGKWHTKNVRVYWLERGASTECEKALNLPFMDAPVIAFKEEWDSFEKMEKFFNIANLNEFIA